jgi:hypothetical protein
MYLSCIGMHQGQILNFQNTCLSACDEIWLVMQSRKFRPKSYLVISPQYLDVLSGEREKSVYYIYKDTSNETSFI